MPVFRTRWRVIDSEGKILFEGYYGESLRYIEENKLTDVKLDPHMEKLSD